MLLMKLYEGKQINIKSPNIIRLSPTVPGSPSQVGSKPGDARRKPNSLWPLGAAWVQIPLPAPLVLDYKN